MLQYSSQRRSILTALAAFGLIQSLLSETDMAHAATPEGFVLGPAGGEHLIHFRDGGNIFIKADPVSGSGNLAMGRSSCPRAQAFRFTDTLIWRRSSTSWKAVARSHSTMYVTLAKEVERFSYPRTRGMVSVVRIRNWFCCGSWRPQASTGSFAKPAAHPANRERN
jgi:hypothetical protein